MLVSYRVSFKFAGESYDEVEVVWGEGRGRRQRAGEAETVPSAGAAGQGWSVGAPTVLAMFAAVERGDATAAQASAVLDEVFGLFRQLSGCCPDCDEAVPAFEAELEHYRSEMARVDDPRSYPYLVTSRIIHDWNCSNAGDRHPVHPGETVSAWVHNRGFYRDTLTPTRLSPEEADRWIESRTGPKGGRSWHRCRICQPELPGAWTSEANSTSSTAPAAP